MDQLGGDAVSWDGVVGSNYSITICGGGLLVGEQAQVYDAPVSPYLGFPLCQSFP